MRRQKNKARFPAIFPVWAAVCALAAGAAAQSWPSKPGPPVAADALRFATPELQARFAGFDAAARLAGARGLAYRPYRRETSALNNAVAAEWSSGIEFDLPNYFPGDVRAAPEHRRITVAADPPAGASRESAAVALRVEDQAPDPAKWCVFFEYREAAGGRAAPSDWQLRLFHMGQAPLTGINLPVNSYEFSGNSVDLGADAPPEKNFLRYARSADAMRAACLTDLERLEARVAAFIGAHRARKSVFGEAPGRGKAVSYLQVAEAGGPKLVAIPPYHQEPLTAEEEKAELAKARQFFAEEARFMRGHSDALYAAWRKAFPLERCWPELKGG